MRARSLKAWSETQAAAPLKLEIELFQALEETHSVYRWGVSIYNWIQNHWPLLHHVYFNVLELLSLHRDSKVILGKEKFVAKVEAYRPAVIVSTHAHLNHGFFELARMVLGKQKVKCVTYCGELHGGYGFSRHWVNTGADLFIGAVPETCHAATDLGMLEEKTAVGGFLLNPAFYRPRLNSEQRACFVTQELGLEPGTFTVVLATGGNSANNHVALLNALARASLPVQVVALCGRSASALADVNNWAMDIGRRVGIRVTGIPFTSRLNELFQVASVVVARPGTGTTSECIQCTCPILFNGLGGIMPQEFTTVKCARQHGFAGVIKTPLDLPRLIRTMIAPSDVCEAHKNALRQVKPALHPMDILHLLVGEKVYDRV